MKPIKFSFRRRHKKRAATRRVHEKQSGRLRAQLLRLQIWLPYVLLVLVLAAGLRIWQLLSMPGTLPFSKVTVQADYRHISAERLHRFILANVSGGFFSLSAEDLKVRVMQQMPWVREVSLRRIWPGTLNIQVYERQAVAVWNGDRLLSRQGVVFQPAESTFPKGLVALDGPSGQAVLMWKRYRVMQNELTAAGLRIAEVHLSERGSWQLQLAYGPRLFLGREQVQERLQRFVAAYDRVMASGMGQMASVDLRYPNGFAIAWRSA